MSQPRQFQLAGSGGGGNPGQYNVDTTFTKVFVGGLAWETKRDTMGRYFEQFGDILEAVVITDKNTGRSKGYGFVTFKDPEAAMRACQNPSPVIDGRRANCNLASLGAQKPRPPNPHLQHHGGGRFRPSSGLLASAPPFHGSSSSSSTAHNLHHPPSQYMFPYSAFGYGYSSDALYPLNYYGVYGGQQLSPYYNAGLSGTAGMIPNLYPYYTHYPQGSQQQDHGFNVQYPPVVQYPYIPQLYGSTGAGILSLPSSVALQHTTSATSITAATTMTRTNVAQIVTPAPRPTPSSIPSTISTNQGVTGARTGASPASSGPAS